LSAIEFIHLNDCIEEMSARQLKAHSRDVLWWAF